MKYNIIFKSNLNLSNLTVNLNSIDEDADP